MRSGTDRPSRDAQTLLCAMPPRRRPPKDTDTPRGGAGLVGIQKSTYMTRDAARRLRLAKKAAKTVLAAGGTLSAAAAAAQAHGTPADAEGGNSDASDSGGDAGEDEDLAELVVEQMRGVGGSLDPAGDAAAASGSGGGAGSGSGAGADGDSSGAVSLS